jgi:nitroimidazol reductase NimA-like FMN-containing flavoprotein (pyridoxamine 5'-phosphate oxidase superfamily)
MEASEEIQSKLTELFSSQKLAVLSTQYEGQPYASLVSFVATDDLKYLLFATSRSTRKYANLAADSRAALLIDSRSNRDSDFHQAIAATATGIVDEIQGPERDRLVDLYLEKHPYLDEFVNSPSNALMRLKVESYIMVRGFQDVVVLNPLQ